MEWATGSGMPSWFFSLQFRLVVGFAVILALATGAVSLYIDYTAQREVDRFQTDFDASRTSRVSTTLAEFYEANGGWAGVQTLIERAGFLSDREIVVVNDAGEVVGDSRARGRQSTSARSLKAQTATIVVADAEVGSVLVAAAEQGRRGPGPFRGPGGFPSPEAIEAFEEPQLVRFAEAINQSLVLAGLAAGATGGPAGIARVPAGVGFCQRPDVCGPCAWHRRPVAEGRSQGAGRNGRAWAHLQLHGRWSRRRRETTPQHGSGRRPRAQNASLQHPGVHRGVERRTSRA